MTGERTDRDGRAGDDPATGTDDSALPARLSVGLDRFTDRFRPLADTLGRATRHSRVGTLGTRVHSAVTNSRIVRWFTREPDPDVLVIDLAATRTVGPLLRVLDAAASASGRVLRRTGLRHRLATTAHAIEHNAVPAVSGALLGLVIGTLALTWQGATPLWLLALSIAGVAAVLGLTVDRSPRAITGSTVLCSVATLLAPPTDDREGTR